MSSTRTILLRRWAVAGLLVVNLVALAAPGRAAVGSRAAASAVPPVPVYQIRNDHSGMCLSVRDAGTQDGDPVTQFPCAFYPDQAWEFSASPGIVGNAYKVINAHSHLCLSVFDAGTNDGAKIDQWDCGFLDQNWITPRIFTDGTSSTGPFVDFLSQKCLSVPDASTQQDVQLDQWDCNPAFVDQPWTVELVGYVPWPG